MKSIHEMKPLTFGSCVASACRACGTDRAEGLLRFAVNANIVIFPQRRHVEIDSRDTRTVGTTKHDEGTGLLRYFLYDDHEHRPAKTGWRQKTSSAGRTASSSLYTGAAGR